MYQSLRNEKYIEKIYRIIEVIILDEKVVTKYYMTGR